MSNAGSAGWRLFLDALEEAQVSGSLGRRKKQAGRPKRHLADLELKSLKMFDQLRKRLDKKLVEMGPDWIPDEAFTEQLKTLSTGVTALARSYRLGREAEKGAREGLSDEQLDEVFKVELGRIASKLAPEDWVVLLTNGMGEDIAHAAVAVWQKRKADGEARKGPTQFSEERQPERGAAQ